MTKEANPSDVETLSEQTNTISTLDQYLITMSFRRGLLQPMSFNQNDHPLETSALIKAIFITRKKFDLGSEIYYYYYYTHACTTLE